MSYKLRPCPFCGLPAEGAMKVCTCEQDTYKMTREQWNTRPLEDALTSEVERLRTALMMLKPEYFRDEKQTAAMELIAVALRGEE